MKIPPWVLHSGYFKSALKDLDHIWHLGSLQFAERIPFAHILGAIRKNFQTAIP